MVAIGTSMTNINNGVAELILLVDHWLTNGTGDMTQEQGFQLAGLVSPFVALLYAKLGIATTQPPDNPAAPEPAVPPKAVAAIGLMLLISGTALIFGHHFRV